MRLSTPGTSHARKQRHVGAEDVCARVRPARRPRATRPSAAAPAAAPACSCVLLSGFSREEFQLLSEHVEEILGPPVRLLRADARLLRTPVSQMIYMNMNIMKIKNNNKKTKEQEFFLIRVIANFLNLIIIIKR